MGEFCLLVERHQEGSVPTACAANTLTNKQAILKNKQHMETRHTI